MSRHGAAEAAIKEARKAARDYIVRKAAETISRALPDVAEFTTGESGGNDAVWWGGSGNYLWSFERGSGHADRLAAALNARQTEIRGDDERLRLVIEPAIRRALGTFNIVAPHIRDIEEEEPF